MPVASMTVAIMIAALGSGLIGGVFLAFSSFVMQALARLPAPQGIAAMQRINITVINPVFLGIFFGTAMLCAGLMVVTLLAEAPSPALLAGGLLYLLGPFGVTIAGNVPHNQRLAKLDPDGSAAAAYWPHYQRLWMRWNHLRCLAAVLAMLAFVLALHGAQG